MNIIRHIFQALLTFFFFLIFKVQVAFFIDLSIKKRKRAAKYIYLTYFLKMFIKL